VFQNDPPDIDHQLDFPRGEPGGKQVNSVHGTVSWALWGAPFEEVMQRKLKGMRDPLGHF